MKIEYLIRVEIDIFYFHFSQPGSPPRIAASPVGALIECLHDCGWRGLVYKVNDTAAARPLTAAGVDGLITDSVDLFKP